MSNQPMGDSALGGTMAAAAANNAVNGDGLGDRPRRAGGVDDLSNDELMDRAGIDRDLEGTNSHDADRAASYGGTVVAPPVEVSDEPTADTITVAKSPTLEEDIAAQEGRAHGAVAGSGVTGSTGETVGDRQATGAQGYDQQHAGYDQSSSVQPAAGVQDASEAPVSEAPVSEAAVSEAPVSETPVTGFDGGDAGRSGSTAV